MNDLYNTSHTSHTSHRCAFQKGFTLIEMLAAIAIFALVSLASWQIMQTLLRASHVGMAQHERMQKLQYAMLIIEQDFQQIVDRGPRINGKVSKQSLFSSDTMLDTDDQAITFVRGGWHNPDNRLPRSTLQRVFYRLKDNKLERLHDYVLDTVENTEQARRVLLEGVTGLTFTFYAKGQWYDQLGKNNELPEAIAIELELKSLGKIRRLFLLPASWKAEVSA